MVLDISGEMPLTMWIQSDSMAYGIHVEEDKVYVAAGEEGLEIFDISDPDSPVLLSALKTSGEAWDVWVQNGFAYVADLDKGVNVIDVYSPGEPRRVGFVTWAERNPSAEIVRGEGNIVCVAAGENGFIVIDVSNPTQPVVASRYRPLRMDWAEGLAVRNGLVYLAMGSDIVNVSTIENGLHILDITNPATPKLLGKLNFLDWVEGVHVTGEYVYVANTYTGVRSISVHNSARPYLVDTFNNFP